MIGVVDLYKEAGMSSHDCVHAARKILKIKKIGHSGTLDPEAEGVLTLYVGKATKYIDLIKSPTKKYVAGFQLGMRSDTLDIWGTVEKTESLEYSLEDIHSVLKSYLGKTLQKPPMYSALKYKGKAYYQYARENIEIERKEREVEIFSIKLLDYDVQTKQGYFSLECTKGTYVRSLIDDFGKSLGTHSVMSSLLRTENDFVDIQDTVCLDIFQQKGFSALRPIDKFLPFSSIELNRTEYEDLCHGRKKNIDYPYNGKKCILRYKNNFVGIAFWEGNKYIKKRIQA